MRNCSYLLTILLLFCSITYAQTTDWHGNLEVNGVRLGLVFHLEQREPGKASLSVPSQGLKELPADEVRIASDSIYLGFKALQIKYMGAFENSSHIKGLFTQRGISQTLELFAGANPNAPLRPQTPAPPFPYNNREVSFINLEENILLKGTFSTPEGKAPFPAVVLVSGSGPQDRDSNIAEHKWFEVIADHLLRTGIAVLRYDDRGVGASEGSFKTATTHDFSKDALAAYQWLNEQPETDPDRTGIAGHSEGGLAAGIVAALEKEVDFLILLATPAVSGKDLLLKQKMDIEMAMGIPKEGAQASNELFRKVYDDLIASDLNGQQLKSFIKEKFNDYTGNTIPQDQLNALSANLATSWMKTFLSYDPYDHLKYVSCPVLGLYGSRDLQVAATTNSKALKTAFTPEQLARTSIEIFPGNNHLFQPADSGLPEEYGNIQTTIDPKVLETIALWIKTQ